MTKLTIEDRIKRDGDRWRYIFLLEEELSRRKTRQSFIRQLLGYSIIVTLVAVYGLLT